MKTEHAIILVAGEGKRLLPFTLDNPKCFAEVSGTTILENALHKFARHGVRRATIVVGHLKEKVIDLIGTSFAGMAIDYVINRDFQSTNSMFSLLLALRESDEPSWVLEGDVFFESDMLKLPLPDGFCWIGDSSIRELDGAYLSADASGRVAALEIIRDLSLLRTGHHKSVGLLHLSGTAPQVLRQWLETGVMEEKSNLYYDLIVVEHLQDYLIRLVDAKGKKWFEIDTNGDLECARRLFA